jgi:hypothetical protein
MKKLLLITLIAVLTITVKAQIPHPMGLTDSTIFESVDVVPKYPDGIIALTNFINANLRHIGEKGLVFVDFIVEKDGSITHVQSIKGFSDDAKKEAVRVIRLSKKWIPGTIRQKPVRTAFTLPIRFS